jgi:hypothetical protein
MRRNKDDAMLRTIWTKFGKAAAARRRSTTARERPYRAMKNKDTPKLAASHNALGRAPRRRR